MLRTLPYDSQVYRSQLHAIREARGYIYIQNAYFSDITIIHELARARLRGVDVRVIIPMEGNHGIMNASNVTAANTLLKYGVRIFTYPGMSHVKAAVYHGWACLGSANFDKLSFRVNKEMNLGVSDHGICPGPSRHGIHARFRGGRGTGTPPAGRVEQHVRIHYCQPVIAAEPSGDNAWIQLLPQANVTNANFFKKICDNTL